MIGRLTGTIVEKDLKGVLLDVQGVGYEVLLPLSDLTRVGALGEKVTLRIHTHVREDALQLFGFLTDEGRTTFLALINVNGVGPKMASGILSGIEPAELADAVARKDLDRLCSIPGVGKKTAERLCLELAGKLQQGGSTTPRPAGGSRALDDLASALSNLGYRTPQVDKVTKALADRAKEGAPVEVLIRDALTLIKG